MSDCVVCWYKTVVMRRERERESVAQCLKCSSHDDRHPLIVMVTCTVLNISLVTPPPPLPLHLPLYLSTIINVTFSA